MLAEKKEKFKYLEARIGNLFSKFLTPNQYTLIAPGLAFIYLFFLTKKQLLWSLVLFSLAASIDFIDGAVARATGSATKRGAYLDTIFDRYVEGIILFGFLFLPLPKILLPAYVWIFLSLFGSLLTTYAKAAAKEKEIVEKELKIGFVGRGERMILVFLALLLGIFNFRWTVLSLITLAILSNLTALQRIYLFLKEK